MNPRADSGRTGRRHGPARALAVGIALVAALAGCEGSVDEGDEAEPVAVGEQEPRSEVTVDHEAPEDGEALFENNCAACHQTDGSGAGEGAILPLAPSGIVALEDPEQLIDVVLDGRAGMPRFRDLLDDEQIAAILTHVRQLGDNDAGEVTPEQVAAGRGNDDGGISGSTGRADDDGEDEPDDGAEDEETEDREEADDEAEDGQSDQGGDE